MSLFSNLFPHFNCSEFIIQKKKKMLPTSSSHPSTHRTTKTCGQYFVIKGSGPCFTGITILILMTRGRKLTNNWIFLMHYPRIILTRNGRLVCICEIFIFFLLSHPPFSNYIILSFLQVSATWVQGLEEYNEWMSEEDYEVDDQGRMKNHEVCSIYLVPNVSRYFLGRR